MDTPTCHAEQHCGGQITLEDSLRQRSVGEWVLQSRIGAGGNGAVYRAMRRDGSVAAIKVLRDPGSRERLGRFRNEVNFLLQEAHTPGVLPLLDHDLEANGGPWYAMPVAVPLRQALGEDPAVEKVVEVIASVSGTLSGLAGRRIAHRDLKPENMFELDGSWLIGDFGLVSYPEAEPLTRHGRRLGPIDYMAPEMRSDADVADPFAADVYALAKTLWVLLTNEPAPLPGPHRSDDTAYSIAHRLAHPWSTYLDSVLSRGTQIDVERRMSMIEVHEELSALCRIASGEARPWIVDSERASRLDRLADADRAQQVLFTSREEQLNSTSSAVHDVHAEVAAKVQSLLPTWLHHLDSGGAVSAYLLMPLVNSYWGQRGRVDMWSIQDPRHAGHRVTLSVTVGIRLDGPGEQCTVAAGVRLDIGATEPRWVRSVVQETPLGSPLTLGVQDEVRATLEAGIDEAMAEIDIELFGRPGDPHRVR